MRADGDVRGAGDGDGDADGDGDVDGLTMIFRM